MNNKIKVSKGPYQQLWGDTFLITLDLIHKNLQQYLKRLMSFISVRINPMHKIMILHNKPWAWFSAAVNNNSIIGSLGLDVFTSAEYIFVWIFIIQD